MTDSMIERVAEAIYSRFWGPQELVEPDDRFKWATASGSAKERMRDMARAAIEAMREPDAWMLAAGASDICASDEVSTVFGPHRANDCWKAMIDAALTEQEKR